MSERDLETFLRKFFEVHVPKFATRASGRELAIRPFEIFLKHQGSVSVERFVEIMRSAWREVSAR